MWLLLSLLGLSSGLWAQNEEAYKKLLQNLKPERTPEVLLLGYKDQGQHYREFYGPYVGPSYSTLVLDNGPGHSDEWGVSMNRLPYLASPQADGFYYLQSAQRDETVTMKYGPSLDFPQGSGLQFYRNETKVLVENSAAKLQARLKAFRVNIDPVYLEGAVSIQRKDGVPEPRSEAQREAERDTVEHYDLTESEDLAYLGPGWIDLVGSSNGYEGGNMLHFYGENTYTLRKGELGPKVNFSVQYSAEAWEAIRRSLYFRIKDGFFQENTFLFGKGDEYFEDRWNDQTFSQKWGLTFGDNVKSTYWSGGEPQFDPAKLGSGFWVGREKGLVSLMVTDNQWIGGDGAVVLTPGGPLKKPFIAYNDFPVSWEGLKKIEPTLIDAFLSPARNLLVVVYAVPGKANRLKVIEVSSGKTFSILRMGTDTAEAPLFSQRIVMADWAVGAENARRWLDTLLPKGLVPLTGAPAP